MKKILNIGLLALLCVGLLSACKKDQLKYDDELIKQTSFDKAKFIEQSKQNRQDIGLGPKVVEDDGEKRKSYRRMINREESFDYVDMSDIEKNNDFKIDINVENMDIRTFAELMSKITGVNILVSDEVQGTITAKLKDVSWTSMIDSVLKTKALAKHVDTKSNIIRIHDQNTVVQLEEFERRRKENVQRALLLKKASQPLVTEIFKLFYTKPSRVKTIIEDVLSSGGLAGDGIRNIDPEITTDERKNLVIVKAREEDIDIVSKLISELDTRTQQVYIEAFIVEVNDDFSRAFGSRFGLIANDRNSGRLNVGGIAGGAPGSSLTLGAGNGSIGNLPASGATSGIGVLSDIGNATQLKIELTAMEQQGLSKVISNPKIFTLDNEEAIIFQGNEVPYETVSQEGTNIEFKEAGLRLAVTPTIVGDGNLLLTLQVNKDTVDLTQDNPPITKSEIQTNLVTKDGEIVVMGGIYSESETKDNERVPGLGELLGVGKLFSRDSRLDDRNELIIFIAPKVI